MKGRALRAWLRRVMPRIAVAAAVLFVVRAMVRETTVYRASAFGSLFGFVTFLLVACTICYYGFRALRWLKRRLLWRVRRRLIITYLFVGLTPIILIGLLGFLFGLSVSVENMARTLTAQADETDRQTLINARALADAFAQLPPGQSEQATQAWLNERVSLLQASQPGARVAIWRAGGRERGPLAANEAARFMSEPQQSETRGVGAEAVAYTAPLPAWVQASDEWNGFTFTPFADGQQIFAVPSWRALVRQRGGEQQFVLLLVVPVNRALMNRFSQNAGLSVRPYFIATSLDRAALGQAGRTDQFGDSLPPTFTYTTLPATDWLSGRSAQHQAFLFERTRAQDMQTLLIGRTSVGQALTQIFLATSIVFLVLELLALFAAGWMTRAVTGTVHKLYRATEHIKRGDFSHRVQVRSQDQLGELALAYNDMTANIETLLQERVERERLEREIEIAAEVQAQLFPRDVPQLKTVALAGECRAARGVAGDYYDYVEVAPGLVALALGDVAGKGISASLVMSNLQASLRAQTTILAERLRLAERAAAVAVGASGEVEQPCGVTGVDNGCAVEEIVANINAQLCRSTDSNRFATFFLALYDERTRTLRYTNAGHNAPFLIRADGTHELLTIGGTVAGAFDFARYDEAATTLAPNDLLLIFSDGLSEAQNHTGEEYGEQRLLQFALQHRELSADELRAALFNEIDQWSGGLERGDDQTVVIVKANR